MGILDRLFKKLDDAAPPVVPEKKTKAKKPKADANFTKAQEASAANKGVLPTKAKKPRAKKKTVKKEPEKSGHQIALEQAKEEATLKKEPWVSVISVELDVDNMSNGSFSLDWNDYFIAKLVRAGYKGTDTEMVDQWFQDICRNVLQENFEQEMADPTNRTRE